jgi:hypothetical protein
VPGIGTIDVLDTVGATEILAMIVTLNCGIVFLAFLASMLGISYRWIHHILFKRLSDLDAIDATEISAIVT